MSVTYLEYNHTLWIILTISQYKWPKKEGYRESLIFGEKMACGKKVGGKIFN